MPTIDEKRVYTDESGTETVYLATGLGVVAVSVSDGLVGEFGVTHRCRARDVATEGPSVAAATDEDVLVSDRSEAGGGGVEAGSGAESGATPGFVATGFGPASAVGFRDGALLAGDADGRLARWDPGDGVWTDLGSVGGVRAVDGDFVAAADGVHQVGESGLRPVGLDDAHDVDGEPVVASGSGLYKLGNGWMDVAPGPATAVDTVGGRGLAVCGGDLYARRGAGEGWTPTDLPFDDDATVAAVAHGADAAYAVTEAGRLAVQLPGEGWRDRSLGLGEVEAAAV